MAADIEKNLNIDSKSNDYEFTMKVESVEPTWQTLFTNSTNKYSGYVSNVEEAMEVIREYELKTTTKYFCFKADKMFGQGGKFNLYLQNIIFCMS